VISRNIYYEVRYSWAIFCQSQRILTRFRNLCESPVAAVCDRQTILKMQCFGGHRPPLQFGRRLLQRFRFRVVLGVCNRVWPDCSGVIVHCRSVLTDCKSVLVNCKSVLTDCKSVLVNCRSVLTDCRSVLIDCRSVLTDCRSVLINCRSVLTDCRSVLTDCRSVLVNCTSVLRCEPVNLGV